MVKKIIVFVVAMTVLLMPLNVEAKTVTRYATKSVYLRTSIKEGSKPITKIKRCQKLKVTKQGKRWAQVDYDGQKLYIKKKWLNKKKSTSKYKGSKLRRAGRLHWGGASWTWYTQRILPGKGLKIPGRHVDKHGFVCDKDDYIVLASSIGYKKVHKVLPTPYYGKYGKVYDTNGTWNYGWRDVYTNW